MGFWSKLFGGWGGSGAPKPGEQAAVAQTPERLFLELCLGRVRAHPKVERAEEHAGEQPSIKLWTRGGFEQQMYLHNLFAETRELAPEARLARIDHFIGAIFTSDSDVPWDEAEGSIVPVIRTAGFGGFAVAAPLCLPFVPFIDLFLVLDRGASMMYVTQKKLDEWQQPAESVLELAMANLAAHVAAADPESPDVELYDASAPHPIWHVTRDDSYETSRLALPGFLASFRDKVHGTPLAIAPHRSLLLVAGDGDPTTVARLAQMAEAEYRAAPRSLSPALYTLGAQDSIVPFTLPPDHPSCQAVRRGHRLLAAGCYAEQHGYLERKFAEEGIELFVAKLSVIESKQGEVTTCAVLPQGVETLLPQADLIALTSEEMQAVLLPWNKFMELAPNCLEQAVEYHPVRYRSVGWPDADTLEALLQHRQGVPST